MRRCGPVGKTTSSLKSDSTERELVITFMDNLCQWIPLQGWQNWKTRTLGEYYHPQHPQSSNGNYIPDSWFCFQRRESIQIIWTEMVTENPTVEFLLRWESSLWWTPSSTTSRAGSTRRWRGWRRRWTSSGASWSAGRRTPSGKLQPGETLWFRLQLISIIQQVCLLLLRV